MKAVAQTPDIFGISTNLLTILLDSKAKNGGVCHRRSVFRLHMTAPCQQPRKNRGQKLARIDETAGLTSVSLKGSLSFESLA